MPCHHTRTADALEDLGQGPELLLRQVPRAQGHQPRDSREQGDGLHRPVGLRQVDLAAHLQPHVRAVSRAARRRHDRAGRREPADLQAGRGADPRQGRHGVPEADAVPDVDLRQHRLRREAVREPQRLATWTTASNGRSRRPRCGPKCATSCSRAARASPAASSSACALRAASRSSPKCCCSTSRARRSTRSRRPRSRN